MGKKTYSKNSYELVQTYGNYDNSLAERDDYSPAADSSTSEIEIDKSGKVRAKGSSANTITGAIIGVASFALGVIFGRRLK